MDRKKFEAREEVGKGRMEERRGTMDDRRQKTEGGGRETQDPLVLPEASMRNFKSRNARSEYNT